MIELIKINNENYVSAKELHLKLGIKKYFNEWFRYNAKRAMLEENKDFYAKLCKSTGGRPSKDYLLTERTSIGIIMMSGGENAKQVRDEVIKTFQSRKNLELITPREAALAYEYINFFKYIENQKEAYYLHQKKFIADKGLDKYVYVEFAKYRTKLIGWNKSKINEAITEYLKSDVSRNLKRILRLSMPEKLSIFDLNEAIRVSVLDLLYSKGTDIELANKFANMVKNVSKEMQNLKAYHKNENNLFQNKENINKPKIIL